MMARLFLAIKYFSITVYTLLFFGHNVIAHLVDYSIVTFICTGTPKIHVFLYCDTHSGGLELNPQCL